MSDVLLGRVEATSTLIHPLARLATALVAHHLNRADRDRRRNLLEPRRAVQRPGDGNECLERRAPPSFKGCNGANGDIPD